METLKHIPLAELEEIIHQLNLPGDTLVSLTIEDDEHAEATAKRLRAEQAMRQLRGSGTGSLVETLRQERERDKHQ